MKRRRIILICAAVIALVALLAVMLWPGPKEPEYQGKKLSEWLEAYGTNSQQSVQAVRAIGTNAVPTLLKWIDYRCPSWEEPLHGFFAKHPRWVGYGWLRRRYERTTARIESTVIGFFILGSNATNAIPALNGVVRTSTNGLASFWAAQGMSYLGQGAVAPLISIAEDKQLAQGKRSCTLRAMANLTYLGTNALPCVATLARCATNSGYFIGACAASQFKRFVSADPAIFRDHRTNAVADPLLRLAAVRVAWASMNDPDQLVLLFSEAAHDPDPDVRSEAMRCFDSLASSSAADADAKHE